MAIRKKVNHSNSGRHQETYIDYKHVLSGDKLTKSLVGKNRKMKRAGRNAQGKITVRHRGGGSKRKYRLIDFKRNLHNDKIGTIKTIEYDPNRSAFISLVTYENGAKTYIITPETIKVGDEIISSDHAIDIKIGNSLPLEFIPEGTMVHNIELTPGAGAKIARSAGSYGQILGMDDTNEFVILKLSSNEMRKISKKARATIGIASNIDHNLVLIGKAGRNRNKGIRPTVRGSAMNPNDHPHGGGEGRSPVGRAAPLTPWGKRHMGVKTRNPKKASSSLIIRRRK